MREYKMKAEYAWAAGLFIGEGWCSTRKNKKQRYIMMGISMKDVEAVERFFSIVKCGSCYTQFRQQKNGRKKYRLWIATSFEGCQYVICLLWDWLTLYRKKQIKKSYKEMRRWWKIRNSHMDRRRSTRVSISENSKYLQTG